MSWISESPLPLLFLALLVQVILGFALWQTGRGSVLFAMIGLACVSLGLLFVEWLWITPREQIANTLDEIAVTLETNQPDAVVEFISPTVPDLRGRALRQLKRAVIDEARVTSEVRVDFDPPSDPPTATAIFIARLRAKEKSSASAHEALAQRFKVKFRQEDGHWKISGVETMGFK